MSCNRCTDIHQAQKEGKTQDSCKCSCHNSYSGNYTYTVNGSATTVPNNLLFWTGSTTGIPSTTYNMDTDGSVTYHSCNCTTTCNCIKFCCNTLGCQNTTDSIDGYCDVCKNNNKIPQSSDSTWTHVCTNPEYNPNTYHLSSTIKTCPRCNVVQP